MTTYQLMRAVQAMLALLGAGFCASNIIHDYTDYRWIVEKHINGLRQMAARSTITHSVGRLVLQLFLAGIGAWGAVAADESAASLFETGEVVIDTAIVIVTFLVSWHAMHTRSVIRHWHAQNDRVKPDPHTHDRSDDTSSKDRLIPDPLLGRRQGDTSSAQRGLPDPEYGRRGTDRKQ